jgi:NADH-quinone oxidoreductase subunit L
MGGLRKYMPITWITSLIGSLALIGTPFLAGFYSKDSIIEAVHFSSLPGAGFAWFAVTAGVFVTAFYSFRMYFLVFHGKERFHNAHAHHGAHDEGAHEEGDSHGHHHAPHESPWVVTLPLVLLAIPSVVIGYLAIEPMLFGGWFGHAIHVDAAAHPAMTELAAMFHGAAAMGVHALTTLPFWLAVAGVGSAYYLYMINPAMAQQLRERFNVLYVILENKYGFDRFNDWFFAGGARMLGGRLWRWGDVAAIDGMLVNGSARLVGRVAAIVRYLQSGYIYHYAFAMLVGVLLLATWFAHA